MTQITKILFSVLIFGFVAESFATLNKIDIYRKEVFNIAVLQNRKPVIVYFTSSSCNICNIVYSKLENFAKENNKSIYIAKVDFDKTPHLKEEYGIEKVPTTRAYVKGELVDEVLGPIWPRIQTMAKSVL